MAHSDLRSVNTAQAQHFPLYIDLGHNATKFICSLHLSNKERNQKMQKWRLNTKLEKKTETETEDAGNHHRCSIKVDMALPNSHFIYLCYLFNLIHCVTVSQPKKSEGVHFLNSIFQNFRLLFPLKGNQAVYNTFICLNRTATHVGRLFTLFDIIKIHLHISKMVYDMIQLHKQ